MAVPTNRKAILLAIFVAFGASTYTCLDVMTDEVLQEVDLYWHYRARTVSDM